MLRSKRYRDRPAPDQVDDRAQRSKDKDEEEEQLINDHGHDSWMKSWWTANRRTRRRPIELPDWLQRWLWIIRGHRFATIHEIVFFTL